MLVRSFHRQVTRLPALILAVGILLLTLVLRPLDDLGFRALNLLIGVSASMLVLLADATAHGSATYRRSSLLLGCASGLLLAPEPFLIGIWLRYAAPLNQLYILCYAMLALIVAALVTRRGQGNWEVYWLAMLGTFLPIFCILCLRWLVNVWDL